MDKIFEKILEIENSAKEVYGEAVQEERRLRELLRNEIAGREQEILKMAEERINQLFSQSKKDVDERTDRINRQVGEKLSELEEQYNKNAKQWEDTVFYNVIGE